HSSSSSAFPATLPCPPTSTLFPYTTLFRSLLDKNRDFTGWLAGVSQGNVIITNVQSGELNTLLEVSDEWHGPISKMAWSPDHSKDRKSTRLNSSHVKISYAVFCLKKKKE